MLQVRDQRLMGGFLLPQLALQALDLLLSLELLFAHAFFQLLLGRYEAAAVALALFHNALLQLILLALIALPELGQCSLGALLALAELLLGRLLGSLYVLLESLQGRGVLDIRL